MSENTTDGKGESLKSAGTPAGAFTFIEVIIALVIVSVSLLGLLELHMKSIRTIERADAACQAVLLANEKIEEILADGYPQNGGDGGTVERNAMTFYWRSDVGDVQLPQLNWTNLGGLRKIVVDVGWKQAAGRKTVKVSSYVAERKLR